MTAITIGGSNESGLKWPNYVNGRLLTAQDLEATQKSVFKRDEWLGLAIGEGIVSGFVVTGVKGGTTLTVSPGVGVNRNGTALRLEASATFDLKFVDPSSPPDGSRFTNCRPVTPNAKPPNAGAYVVAVCPQTWYDGKVAVQDTGKALPTPCVSRWEVEGVVFKVVPLDGFKGETTPENRRNRLAHWCFGSDALGALAMGGFSSTSPFRGIDTVPAADLSPCDLPLAVFDWNGSTLEFVDLWSARRRTARPSAAVSLPELVTDERAADGEARLLQFHDHLSSVLAPSGTTQLSATSAFPSLPPAGVLPIHWATTIALLQDKFDLTAPQVPFGNAVPAEAPADVGVTTMIAEPGNTFDIFGLSWMPGWGFLNEFQTELQQLREQFASLQQQLGKPAGTAAADARRKERAQKVVELLLASGSSGVDLKAFFEGVNVRLGVVEPETVDFTVRRSWCDEPLKVGSSSTVNVFFVVDDLNDMKVVAPYVLFAKRIRGARWLTTSAEPLG